MSLGSPRSELWSPRNWRFPDAVTTVLKRLPSIALGGIGLIVPPLVGILTWLTPLAAVALALVMAGAFWTHSRRQEPQNMAFNAVLLILLLIVAWGRYSVAPS